MQTLANQSSQSQFTQFQLAEKKPDIVEVIGERIELRRAGKEYVGLCLFHDDRRPSLYVNPEKQVFLCRACQASGDVIDFIKLVEGCSFREALSILGIAPGLRQPVIPTPRRRAAEKVICWVNEQRARLNEKIRELDEEIQLADELDDAELAESFWRERRLVADLRDDLGVVEYLPAFLELKESIEAIAGDNL